MIIIFQTHIYELKYRTLYFLISFIFLLIICYFYKIELFFIISKSFLKFNSSFIFTKITEPFLVYLKLIIFFSIINVIWLFFYLYGFFFFKSLYNYQIKFLLIFIFIYYLFIYNFIAIILKFIIPIILNFFLLFERLDLNSLLLIFLEAKIDEYLSFFFLFIFLLIFIIHLPFIFIFIILKYKLFNIIKIRKYSYILYLFFFNNF